MKASDNPFPSILIEEAAEPSAPAAGHQRLYIDSSSHKLKRTDSSGTDVTIEAGDVASDAIWDAKGDLAVGTGANAAQKLTVGTDGYVLTADSAETTGLKWAESAGGSIWTLDVNESGDSFANFTAGSGTWSSTGTVIQQTNSGSGKYRTKYNPLIELGYGFIMEVETQFVTVGTGTERAGLVIGDSTAINGLIVYLDYSADAVKADRDSATALSSFTVANVVTSQWYKLRVVVVASAIVSVYLDGTHVGNVPVWSQTWPVAAILPGLYCENAAVEFRNFKVWTMSGTAPA